MRYEDWPDCAILVCPNKCCLRLHSKYCWPHTPGIYPDEVRESLEAELEDAPEVHRTEIASERR